MFPDEFGTTSPESQEVPPEAEPEPEPEHALTQESATEDESEPPAPEPKPANDPDFQKFVQWEQNLLRREEALRAQVPDLEKIDQQLAYYEDLKRQAHIDPISFIKAIAPDVDLRNLSVDSWYEYKGEEAPAEHRLQRQVRKLSYEQEVQRKQWEARERQLSEERAAYDRQQAVNQYRAELSQFLDKADSGKYQLASRLTQTSKEKALSRALDHASRMATAYNRAPSYEEVVQALEQDLSDLGWAPPTPNGAPPAEPPRKAAPGTLRNEHSSIVPSREEVDPMDPEVLRRAAYAEVGLDPDDPALSRYIKDR